jgi:O-antigen/teichoic acid export membrane protein
MLSKIKDTAAVALYSAAGKILEALLIIPLACIFIYLPVIAKEFLANNRHTLKQLVPKIIRALMIIVIPLSLGIAYFAKPIIITLYGEQYHGSAIALQILILAFLLFSTDMIFGMLCKAGGFQKIDLFILIVNTIVNITLNLILIPPFGYIGASVATVVSICVSLISHYIFVKRKIVNTIWLPTIIRPLVAAFSTLLLLHPFDSEIHFLTHVIMFGSGYVLILFLIKGISAHEIKSLFRGGILKGMSVDS